MTALAIKRNSVDLNVQNHLINAILNKSSHTKKKTDTPRKFKERNKRNMVYVLLN